MVIGSDLGRPLGDVEKVRARPVMLLITGIDHLRHDTRCFDWRSGFRCSQ